MGMLAHILDASAFQISLLDAIAYWREGIHSDKKIQHRIQNQGHPDHQSKATRRKVSFVRTSA